MDDSKLFLEFTYVWYVWWIMISFNGECFKTFRPLVWEGYLQMLSSQGRKWEAVRKFAPRRSPESLKACRGPARLLHPLPRDPSSSSAAADSSLTRANPLGSSNETPNISSRIYLSLPLQLCSCKITKSDDRIWSGNSLTLRLYEPLQGPLW